MPKNRAFNRNTNQRGKPAGTGSSNSSGKPSPSGISQLANAVSQLSSEAVEVALKEGIEPQAVETPQAVQNSDLDRLYKETQEAKSIFEQLRMKYAALVSEGELKSTEITDVERRWQEKQHAQNERERKLIYRDAEITGREADAVVGFLAQHEAVLTEVKTRIEALQEVYASFGSTISDGSAALLDEHRHTVDAFVKNQRDTLAAMREDYQHMLVEIRNHWEQELQSQAQREQHLMEREKALRIGEHKLQAAREIQDENEEVRKALAEENLKLKTRSLQETIEELKRTKEDLTTQLDKRVEELRQWDSLIQMFQGERNPETIKKSIQKRIDEAAQEERNKYKGQDLERVERQLGEEQDRIRQITDERDQLNQQIAALKRQNNDLQVNAWDLEDAQLAKKSLEKSRELLQERLKDLQAQIDRITDEQNKNVRPFEQCSAMDTNAELQKSISGESITDLKTFARDVQKTMENSGFFYEARDVRSFIGGLAMSRLMILQGISGTGKTSLPIQFAKAVGGVCEVIEVQSSWRDREDLLGYYNSFERSFHERSMLTALYQAHCPQNRDRIFMILLDEMNLSYPEQYFADFLSVLERQDATNASLEIVSKHIDQLPQHLHRGYRGVQLNIPPNVWFVGTANRDETTKDIADKTYDRAHIMELPDTHADDNGKRERARREFVSTMSFDSLKKLFAEVTGKKYGEEVKNALDFLNALREHMAQTLPLTWGNRLEKQIRQYIPVVLSCGGDAAEAVDHILATRILRKLQDRYDVSSRDLQTLQDRINDTSIFAKTTKLERSNNLLEHEIAQKLRSS